MKLPQDPSKFSFGATLSTVWHPYLPRNNVNKKRTIPECSQLKIS